MREPNSISLNRYFFIPFLVWVIAGAVLLLNYSRLNLFFAPNTHYSDWANVLLYYTTYMGQAQVIVPVLLLLALLPRFRNWWYLLQAALCNLIPFFTEQIMKSAFDRPRPRAVYIGKPWLHFLPEWPVFLSRSFPSGHSAGAFSFFCFLSFLLPQRYRAVGFVFFLLAFAVAYSRMYLAAHFFDDVYAGSIIGACTTAAVYMSLELMRRARRTGSSY